MLSRHSKWILRRCNKFIVQIRFRQPTDIIVVGFAAGTQREHGAEGDIPNGMTRQPLSNATGN